MQPIPPPIRSLQGYTLPEVVVSILILGVLAFAVIALLQGGQRLLPGRYVSVNGTRIPVAPSPEAFAEAIKYHGVLQERLNGARAIYVFGGIHDGLPNGASRAAAGPLALTRLPVLDLRFGRGLQMDAVAFHREYSSALGPMEPSSQPSDFSVVIVGVSGGALAATTLLQVRETSLQIGDASGKEAFTRFEASLFDISGEIYRYTFVERPGNATAAKIGARHFWFRYLEGEVAEEGPVLAVFPDPWLHGGRSSEQVAIGVPAAFSRFVYSFPISP